MPKSKPDQYAEMKQALPDTSSIKLGLLRISSGSYYAALIAPLTQDIFAVQLIRPVLPDNLMRRFFQEKERRVYSCSNIMLAKGDFFFAKVDGTKLGPVESELGSKLSRRRGFGQLMSQLATTALELGQILKPKLLKTACQ